MNYKGITLNSTQIDGIASFMRNEDKDMDKDQIQEMAQSTGWELIKQEIDTSMSSGNSAKETKRELIDCIGSL